MLLLHSALETDLPCDAFSEIPKVTCLSRREPLNTAEWSVI